MGASRHWKILAAIIFVTTIEPAIAQDAAECFTPITHANICGYGRELQAKMAPLLPMKISSNVTIMNIVSVGPRLAVTAVWQMTKAAFDEAIKSNLTAQRTITETSQKFTQNTVCSDPVMSAFVRLKGQIQYIYKTIDGFLIMSPTVTEC